MVFYFLSMGWPGALPGSSVHSLQKNPRAMVTGIFFGNQKSESVDGNVATCPRRRE
jgi:hypothetical protein